MNVQKIVIARFMRAIYTSRMKKDFYVYMLSNKKHGVIYKGVTSNIIKRIYEHKHLNGSKFTSTYNLKKLVWFERCENWENAIAWEKRLRRYPRQWKINLIEKDNPKWRDLYEQLVSDTTDKPWYDGVKG